ncbi:M20 family metallopeptidase [Cohnella silvisoli]|uniref:M20 family metallopeptidase n=1 Tax=Cohnella silvisoli TaxID=2873699 RepID=A0ABV1L3E7_9BACL|nr:M20 family metallopeptidase [Cohnella silvisoli]MCD9021627.1 M20 family metallopeptidase [Cohnella silvisoli]
MKHRSVEILEELIRIPSVNPHFNSGGCGEQKISEYIEQRCLRSGLKVTRQQVFPGRDNLIIELRTGKPDMALLFEAHMDTVAFGSMVNPLVPTYLEERLYGRGACDTKACLGAMIYAMEECAKHPENLSCDLILCASVDEEHAYRGLMAFMELDIPIVGAVVGETTEMGIVVAHKGCVRFAVHTHGKAAHSSIATNGNNAIYQMVKIIRYITEQMEPALATRSHPLCGSPSVVVGTIRGGEQINIVPESCSIEVDWRIIPGEDPVEVMKWIRTSLGQAMEGEGVDFTIEQLLLDYPLNTPFDSLVVQHAQSICGQLNLSDSPIGVPYGSDASKLQQLKRIPSIVFGPGSVAQAHSKEEWVPVKDVQLAAEFYVKLAQSFGKPLA